MGTGIRDTWQWSLNLAAFGTCASATAVSNQTGVSEPVQENKPFYVNDDNSIEPYSTAIWAAQYSGQDPLVTIPNTYVLGSFGGSNTLTSSAGFANKRTVYNIVSTARIAEPKIAATFVGSGAFVCSQPGIVEANGFCIAPNCGTGYPG